MRKPTVAVVDTTFSRVNMGEIALDELKPFKVNAIRRTVPGIKDLAVECKRLLDGGADIALALGMVGGADLDRMCGHEASLGMQMAKIATGKHIIEVFVHETEGSSGKDLAGIFEDRTRKHARNAARMLLQPGWFIQHAGQGLRQGRQDVGSLKAGIRLQETGIKPKGWTNGRI